MFGWMLVRKLDGGVAVSHVTAGSAGRDPRWTNAVKLGARYVPQHG